MDVTEGLLDFIQEAVEFIYLVTAKSFHDVSTTVGKVAGESPRNATISLP
jgi:hypothetical protein